MTKKQNRQLRKRRTRRALNNGVDLGKQVSGRRLNRHNYGAGVGRVHGPKHEWDFEVLHDQHVEGA